MKDDTAIPFCNLHHRESLPDIHLFELLFFFAASQFRISISKLDDSETYPIPTS